MPGGRLSPKRAQFVREYLIDLNGAAAARRAGYAGNDHVLSVTASRLLANADITAAVSAASQARAERTGITADVILQELLRAARVDISLAFNDDGTLKPLKDIPEDVRRAIAGIEVDELFEGHGEERTQIGITRKVKFWDKIKALELLGKHLKLFTDKIEHSVGGELAKLLDEADARAAKP